MRYLMSRMQPHIVNIPDAKPPSWHAADIVISELRKCGVDPRKAVVNPVAIACAKGWTQGELDDAGFRRCMRNLLILNPGLKL